MAVPCQCSPQNVIIAFEKFFLIWEPVIIQKDWKATLESAYSCMLKYSKMTVCQAIKSKQKKIKTRFRFMYKYDTLQTNNQSNQSKYLLIRFGKMVGIMELKIGSHDAVTQLHIAKGIMTSRCWVNIRNFTTTILTQNRTIVSTIFSSL